MAIKNGIDSTTRVIHLNIDGGAYQTRISQLRKIEQNQFFILSELRRVTSTTYTDEEFAEKYKKELLQLRNTTGLIDTLTESLDKALTI